MKVAKRFRWEAAHRLPWHTGGCQHLHGHSYRMRVELEGETGEHGMVIDFKEIKRVLAPLVDAWDHATLVADYDEPLREAVEQLGSKYAVLPFDTTSENMCRYVADYLTTEAADVLQRHGIERVRVRIHETETCYAEHEQLVLAQADDRLRRVELARA